MLITENGVSSSILTTLVKNEVEVSGIIISIVFNFINFVFHILFALQKNASTRS